MRRRGSPRRLERRSGWDETPVSHNQRVFDMPPHSADREHSAAGRRTFELVDSDRHWQREELASSRDSFSRVNNGDRSSTRAPPTNPAGQQISGASDRHLPTSGNGSVGVGGSGRLDNSEHNGTHPTMDMSRPDTERRSSETVRERPIEPVPAPSNAEIVVNNNVFAQISFPLETESDLGRMRFEMRTRCLLVRNISRTLPSDVVRNAFKQRDLMEHDVNREAGNAVLRFRNAESAWRAAENLLKSKSPAQAEPNTSLQYIFLSTPMSRIVWIGHVCSDREVREIVLRAGQCGRVMDFRVKTGYLFSAYADFETLEQARRFFYSMRQNPPMLRDSPPSRKRMVVDFCHENQRPSISRVDPYPFREILRYDSLQESRRSDDYPRLSPRHEIQEQEPQPQQQYQRRDDDRMSDDESAHRRRHHIDRRGDLWDQDLDENEPRRFRDRGEERSYRPENELAAAIESERDRHQDQYQDQDQDQYEDQRSDVQARSLDVANEGDGDELLRDLVLNDDADMDNDANDGALADDLDGRDDMDRISSESEKEQDDWQHANGKRSLSSTIAATRTHTSRQEENERQQKEYEEDPDDGEQREEDAQQNEHPYLDSNHDQNHQSDQHQNRNHDDVERQGNNQESPAHSPILLCSSSTFSASTFCLSSATLSSSLSSASPTSARRSREEDSNEHRAAKRARQADSRSPERLQPRALSHLHPVSATLSANATAATTLQGGWERPTLRDRLAVAHGSSRQGSPSINSGNSNSVKGSKNSINNNGSMKSGGSGEGNNHVSLPERPSSAQKQETATSSSKDQPKSNEQKQQQQQQQQQQDELPSKSNKRNGIPDGQKAERSSSLAVREPDGATGSHALMSRNLLLYEPITPFPIVEQLTCVGFKNVKVGRRTAPATVYLVNEKSPNEDAIRNVLASPDVLNFQQQLRLVHIDSFLNIVVPARREVSVLLLLPDADTPTDAFKEISDHLEFYRVAGASQQDDLHFHLFSKRDVGEWAFAEGLVSKSLLTLIDKQNPHFWLLIVGKSDLFLQ